MQGVGTQGSTSANDSAGAIKILAGQGGITAECHNDKTISLQNAAADTYIRLNANNTTAASETIQLVNNHGTDNSSIALSATSGGITMKVADGKDLTMGNANSDAYFKVAASDTAGSEDVRMVNTNGTDEAAIAVTATAGGVDIDAAASKNVDIAGGQVLISSKDDSASAIQLTTNVGTSETIVVTNTQGTDNGAIALTSTAGGITMKVADEKDLTMGNANSDAYFKVAASATAGNEDLRIVNTNGTDEAAIAVTATAGGVDIDAAASKNVDIAGGQVLISSKDNAASAIALTANVGTTETIVVTNTKGTTDGGSASGAISLTATAGGVGIDAAASKDVDIAGGQVLISSKDDTASAIGLTTNVGTSETIVVTNTQGTADAAIALTASAGGISLTGDNSSMNMAKDGEITHTFAANQKYTMKNPAGTVEILLDDTTDSGEKITVTNSLSTADDAVSLNASLGGIEFNSKKLGFNVEGNITLENDSSSSDVISLLNKKGTAAGSVSITSEKGGITNTFHTDHSFTIKNDTNNGDLKFIMTDDTTTPANEVIQATNTNGTADTAIELHAHAGGVTLESKNSKLEMKTAGDVTLTTTQGSDDVLTVSNTKGTADAAVAITSTLGGMALTGANSSMTMATDGTMVNTYKDGKSYTVKNTCLLYTSPSPRDLSTSRMPSSA